MKSMVGQVFSLVGLVCQVNYFSYAIEVTTPIGKIIGSDHLRTRHGKVIYSFTGIPYAQPPVGDLRFKEPLPVSPWKKPFNATRSRIRCPQQLKTPKPQGEEDCLILNVHSPKMDFTAKLPVMVFIHGGTYKFGASGHSPELLLDREVVFIDINYRLGALGFMTTDDGVVPANLGMKDQVLALKWVHDNIENFGGDPSLVTVFGLSAGGFSTHLLLLSSLSQGLVHRGISMSGSGMSLGAVIPMQLANKRTRALAVLCGCPSESSQKLLDCMRKIPAEIIVEMAGKFDYHMVPKQVFAPVIELGTSNNTFLPSDPEKMESNIPWMAGVTSSDALYFPSNLLVKIENKELDLTKQFEYLFPRALQLDTKFNRDEVPLIFKRIKDFYLGDEPVVDERRNIQKVVDMFTDAWYLSGTVDAASKYKADTYLYYYDYLSSVSLGNVYGRGNIKGVCHGDDLVNIFPMSGYFPNRTWSKTDLTVSETMLDLWTNFAKYGKPTVNTSLTWEPIEKKPGAKKYRYLHITGDAFAQKENLLPERMAFWRSLKDNITNTI